MNDWMQPIDQRKPQSAALKLNTRPHELPLISQLMYLYGKMVKCIYILTETRAPYR